MTFILKLCYKCITNVAFCRNVFIDNDTNWEYNGIKLLTVEYTRKGGDKHGRNAKYSIRTKRRPKKIRF